MFVLVGCDQQTEVAQEQIKTEFISQSTVIPDTPVPNTPMPTKIEAPKIKKKESQLPKPPQGKSDRIKAVASKYSPVSYTHLTLPTTPYV